MFQPEAELQCTGPPKMDGDHLPLAKLRCPQCASRLEVLETSSGGRMVSVIVLGPSVERDARALERFVPPGAGPDVICPACRYRFDPAQHYRTFSPPSRKGPRDEEAS